jgi:uncharacterized protein YndB with AHSA1/START domain
MPVGQTRDVGFQFGIRRTFPVSIEMAWDYLFSNDGLKIWLGELNEELNDKAIFKTSEGVLGKVRVFKKYSHIRLNWQKPDWNYVSTVQIRLIPNRDKTIISFHQEKLMNAQQRKQMQEYWNKVIKEISHELK